MKLVKTNQKGIYYTKNKSDKITYYGSYKSKITNNSVRKKLLVKDKHLEKYAKECLILLDKIKEENNNFNTNIIQDNEIEYKNYLSLNELAEIYFTTKYDTKKRKLQEQYNHLKEDEFNNFQVVKKKLYNQTKEQLRYKKNAYNTDLGNCKLNQMNRKIIDSFLENNLSNTNLGEKSKYMIFSQIKTIINFGIRKELINIKNPLDFINMKSVNKVRERVLSEKELKLLLETCKKYKQNINVYLSVYLAVLTGARANTILNIRKKDFDLENNTLSLYNFKSSKQYKLTLNKQSINWFRDKIFPYFNNSNEYIIRPIHEFNRKNPPQVLSVIPKKVYDIMDSLFNKDLDKQNNIDRDKIVNFHTIRRSIATNLVKGGTSVYNVMILLNHSSIDQTMKYLNITNNDLDNDLSNLMNNLFDKKTYIF